jgi:Zn-dependent protease
VQLAEPTPTRFDLHFTVFGIPVRIHPLFWLVTSVLGAVQAQGAGLSSMLILLALWVVAAMISLVVHELGHALAAKYHELAPEVVIYSMGGVTRYRPGRLSHGARLFITLAGPAAGFAAAGLVIALLLLSGHRVIFPGLPFSIGEGPVLAGNLGVFSLYLLMVNIFWGIMNLMPVVPLDGGMAVYSVLESRKPGRGLTGALKVSIAASLGLVVASVLFYHSTLMALMFGYMGFQAYQNLEQFK